MQFLSIHTVDNFDTLDTFNFDNAPEIPKNVLGFQNILESEKVGSGKPRRVDIDNVDTVY